MTRLSFAFAATLCLVSISPHAAAAESSILYNQQTALCAYPISNTAEAYLHQTTCTGDNQQLWVGEVVSRLTNGTSYMRLRNKLTGLCADIEIASTLNGTRIVQRACSTATTQQWTTPINVVWSTPGSVGPSTQPNQGMTNRFSGKCLEAPADTTPLRQNACGSSNYQKWFYAL